MVTLPKLSYAYDALEPYIDAKTMEIHHSKHHQTYVDKYNAVIATYPELNKEPIEYVLAKLSTIQVNEKDRTAIQNYGGGVFNHTFFWTILGPKKEIDSVLSKRLIETFGSLESFKEQFTTCALNHFGSGWAWLVENEAHQLMIYSLPNQDSPLSRGDKPLITLDLWEHAYYLTYHNKRADYIANWWNVLKLI